MTVRATPRPCGSWPSPISIDAMLASGTGLSSVAVDAQDVYWLESRPQDEGRTVLVRRTDGEPEVLTPAPANVRGRVQEYGGGTFDVAEGIVAWCNDDDAAVHVLEAGADRAITGSDKGFVYGDLRVVPRHRLVLAVREDHHGEGEAVTEIVALSLETDNADGGRVLVTGADFYASPELAADDRLAWVEWSHPNMPWDATRLMLGRLVDGDVLEAQQVAGGEETSVLYPKWAGARLVHLSDETGFWVPWVLDGERREQVIGGLYRDFCRPLWVLGNDMYAVIDDDTLAMYCYDDARAKIGIVGIDDGRVKWLEDTFADVDSIAAGPAGIFAVIDHEDRFAQLLSIDPSSRATTSVREASFEQPAPEWVSHAESIWFEGEHGPAQAWYFPPTNPGCTVPADELPPMIVNTHGGPTGMSPANYRTGFQYWTSRGFALLDINYSGSAGFGREYRNRLYGNWGVADIDDCRDAVAAVVDRGLADPKRIAIRGGSAGGYTTLQALVSTDIFAAGVSSYGIGDLEMLVTDTHKFESRYPFKIVGPYPEAKDVYVDRSPIHHIDRLSSPMLILQGLDDKVVPPNQAVAMADAVRAKKLPVALMMLEGEGHGFRKNSTRRTVIEAQLSFFSQLFDFTPADEVAHLEVENL